MSAHVPDDSSTEPQATRIEQCPNCAIVMVRGDKGFYCVVCGFPRIAKQPTRQLELADYIERLRRNESGADAKGLVELAQKLGLRWGRPELTPDRSLKLNRFDGPVLAVQEATGSDKYLVVLCGEASWSTGLWWPARTVWLLQEECPLLRTLRCCWPTSCHGGMPPSRKWFARWNSALSLSL